MSSQLKALRRLGHDLRGSCSNLRMALQAGQSDSALLLSLAPALLEEVERLDRRLLQLHWWARCSFPQLQPLQLSQMLRRLLGEKFSSGPDGFWQGDPDLLEAAVSEVMDNGRRYGGGLKRVSLSLEKDSWVVTFEDKGPGWPEGLQAWLDQPGWKLWRDQVALGLSLARAFVEAHQGRMLLLPSSPGATLQWFLPRGDQ